jgi:hypothetical protein
MDHVSVNPIVMKKVFQQLKKVHPKMVLYVSRTCDDKVVIYNAIRKEDKLEYPYLEIYFTWLNNPQKKEEVHGVLLDNFFGCHGTSKMSRSFYKTQIRALADRELNLVLKKSGKVEAQTRFTSEEHPVKVLNVHMDLTFNVFNFPTLKSIIIHAMTNEKKIVTDWIQITKEMEGQWNIAALMKTFYA